MTLLCKLYILIGNIFYICKYFMNLLDKYSIL
nr:MAG TPA: hypothetical protein [Caudoviricetes sp.]